MTTTTASSTAGPAAPSSPAAAADAATVAVAIAAIEDQRPGMPLADAVPVSVPASAPAIVATAITTTSPAETEEQQQQQQQRQQTSEAAMEADDSMESESKKRKQRSEEAAAEVLDTSVGMRTTDPQQFSDDDAAMDAVMAKMKEANEAALHTTTSPNGQLVSRSGEQRVQLYDSKRMSRVSFNSWYEFDAYFEMYMQDTFQPFRMRSSCSVEAYRRNQQKVMMNNKNSRGRRIEFPDSAIHHHRIYMCTHAMKARCRGATTRPGQKYRGIGCIAKINVKISPSDNPSKYMVIVTDQVVTHNHPISKDIYESYPDVLLKTMRRNQLTTALLTRQPTPKFETAAQAQKYERAVALLNSVAEVLARQSDVEYETQLSHLQKFYTSIITDNAQV